MENIHQIGTATTTPAHHLNCPSQPTGNHSISDVSTA